ncbi:MAG: acetylornithine deacetylase [Gammaproteobacteria bacterium]|nr:acetylornithine deacetylase [Gammaproteobacteria bacterium]
MDPRLDVSNAGVIELLAGWFESCGFTVHTELVAAQPRKLNLIATCGTGAGGLVLAGHTDTVPCDASAWLGDPFVLREADGFVHGLGVSDMKNFFPVILEALDGLDLSRGRHGCTVIATCDEECTMNGARHLLARRQCLGRYAMLGEPTGLTPITRHKAVLSLAVGVRGRTGHASDPGLGVNAIDGMFEVLRELRAWRQNIRSGWHDDDFVIPYPTLNFGRIGGGDSTNRICGDCELQLDLRLLPGMDAVAVCEELDRLARRAVLDTGCTAAVWPLSAGTPALAPAGDSELVRFCEHETGRGADSAAFATEAPFLAALGSECVVLGAGDIGQAHQPNERLSLEQAAAMTRIVRHAMERFCLRP